MSSKDESPTLLYEKELPLTVWQMLRRPFGRDDVSFEDVQVDSDIGRGLCRPVVKDSSLFDRLNTVLGPENWSLAFSHETENIYSCRLIIGTAYRDGIARSIDPLEACISAARKAMAMFGIGVGLHGPANVYVERAPGGHILNKDEIMADLADIGAISDSPPTG